MIQLPFYCYDWKDSYLGYFKMNTKISEDKSEL